MSPAQASLGNLVVSHRGTVIRSFARVCPVAQGELQWTGYTASYKSAARRTPPRQTGEPEFYPYV
jgi:hypothetical protein